MMKDDFPYFDDDKGYWVFWMLLFLPFAALYVAYAGWAASLCWNWLAVPIFKIQPITVAQAIAIAVVVGSFKFAKVSVKRDKEKRYQDLFNLLAGPLFSVGMAWAIKGFI